MNPVRDPVFRRELLLFAGVGAVTALAGWFASPLLAVGVLIGTVCACLVFCLLQRRRLLRMSRLSRQARQKS